MHTFATDSNERRVILFFLAAGGIAAAWGLSASLNALKWTVPWWLDAPAVLGFYGVFFKVFDYWVWRLRLLRGCGLVRVPDLAGKWQGYITSSFDEHAERHEVSVQIEQHWTTMMVRLKSKTSESYSIIGVMLLDTPKGPTLIYEYQNEPFAHAEETMHVHRGMAHLGIGAGALEGEYYTGRDRESHGIIHLRQVVR